jgi:PKD repeat protein
MIAIAVVASIVAYAWVAGYIGGQTQKSGNAIQIQSQSFTTGGNLILYVQNTGQGTVHLKQDGSVYVNDVLKNILSYDGNPASNGERIPVNVGKTIQLVIDCQYHAGDKIKVVTIEGTFMETQGSGSSGGSGTSGGSSNQPLASFTFAPTSPGIGETVTFTDTSSGGSGINQWSRNFGDGGTSVFKNPTHSYSTSGSKTVTLTVTDTNGKTSTITHTLTVSGFTSPSASFTFNPTAPAVSQSVKFTDTSTPGSGTINQWSWNFGTGATPATSTTQSPSASFASSGQKTVSLTVTDSNGKTSTTSQTVNVGVDAPTAQFTMSTSNPNVGQTVTFTDTSLPASTGTINQWSWTFGDGGTSTAQNPTHPYSTPGQKTITLAVTDTNGKTSTATHTLTVDDYVAPVASFTYAPAEPVVGQTVSFTDTSTQGSGTINQWSWNFGSGATPATSTTHNPTASFASEGQKTISLTVTDSNGKTSTTTQTIQVNALPTPTPTPTTSPTPTPTTSPTPSPTPTATPTPTPTATPTQKLVLSMGSTQTLIVGQPSSQIRIQRQTSSGTQIASGDTLVTLTATSGAFYSDAYCTAQISSRTISNGQSYVDVYYKASVSGTPTLTASATNYAPASTVFTINNPVSTTDLPASTHFDGQPWDQGWNYWTNPPWGVYTSTYFSAPNSVRSVQSNQGAFSSSPQDATGAKYITVTFEFMINQYVDPTDFQVRYGVTVTNNYNDVDWHNLGVNLGDTSVYAPNVWHQFTVTIPNSPTFTTNFRFQFLSQTLSSSEAIYVDNVQITMYK